MVAGGKGEKLEATDVLRFHNGNWQLCPREDGAQTCIWKRGLTAWILEYQELIYLIVFVSK